MSAVPFFLVFLTLSVGFAALRGGAPERWAAALYTAATVASATIGLFEMPGAFADIHIRLVLIDTATAAAITVLAVLANRVWLMPAAACQILAVLAHVARLLVPAMIPAGYAFLIVFWSWPMVLLLFVGGLAHDRRRLIGKPVPPWKRFFEQRALRRPTGWLPYSWGAFH